MRSARLASEVSTQEQDYAKRERKTSTKPVKREDQWKCINAEEMRTITNDECMAGKIKFDESENAVMDESRIG